MTANLYGCTNCGYLMEASAPGLCFPCMIANAKSAMSVALAPRSASATAAQEKTSRKDAQPARLKQRHKAKKDRSARKSPESGKPDATTRLATKDWQPGGKDSAKRKPSKLICSLCNRSVAEGEMLAHVRADHREMLSARPSAKRQKKRMWVSVVQGGLPSLGKRR